MCYNLAYNNAKAAAAAAPKATEPRAVAGAPAVETEVELMESFEAA